MPECDGWTVLNRLKSDSELAEIPVIMVTVVDNEARGLDLGASNYLIKPVQRDRLAVLVEKHRVARSSPITDTNSAPFSYLPPHRHPPQDTPRPRASTPTNDSHP